MNILKRFAERIHQKNWVSTTSDASIPDTPLALNFDDLLQDYQNWIKQRPDKSFDDWLNFLPVTDDVKNMIANELKARM